MKTVEKLRYVILDEWVDDPPAGCTTYYYPVLFRKISETIPTIDEIVDHVKVAAGYDDLDDYDEDELDEDILEEIEGLDPRTKNGYIRTNTLINWDWDNGGSGCGCTMYAEGKDIPEAIATFYEEKLRDDLGEPNFDFYDEMDDDEEIEIVFTVSVCPERGDGGDVSVTIPVSVRELKILALCAIKDEDFENNEALADLVFKIEVAALDECENINDELENDDEESEEIDYSGATLMLNNPIDGEDYNIFTADYIVEYAKEHNTDPEAIDYLATMMEELLENHNESMW